MNDPNLQSIVIVGGGTAGWMTAAALATVLRGQVGITLVESDEIGTVGVGEATIPLIRRFNQIVGIDENDFLKATQGTFKMGIEFVNWGQLGSRYIHGFGAIGRDLSTVPFHQYWLRLAAAGKARPLGEYSLNQVACTQNRFMPPRSDVPESPLADLAHAYHFDAGLYAKYLSKLAQGLGVQRIEGKVVRATQREGDGFVQSVVLESGQQVSGELFIDCSGFRGLLIEETLKTGYEDWTHWLPCDRAWAVPCESVAPLTPYTRSTAHRAGWQWRIPLQHRIGNGHVFCSAQMSDDEAAAVLLGRLDGQPLAAPRLLKFTTGMRRQAWNRNVVAVGLSSGFLEPLESTSIHLIQAAIIQLIEFFPSAGFNRVEIDEYNRQSRFHFERIRDFIILHYHLNQRTDSPFWQQCAAMPVPDALRHKLNLFEHAGRLLRVDNELFAEVAWLQVMNGQGLKPRAHHPLVNLHTEQATSEYLQGVHDVVLKCATVMPDHAAYIAEHCAAGSA